jgi:hypothetical protein
VGVRAVPRELRRDAGADDLHAAGRPRRRSALGRSPAPAAHGAVRQGSYRPPPRADPHVRVETACSSRDRVLASSACPPAETASPRRPRTGRQPCRRGDAVSARGCCRGADAWGGEAGPAQIGRLVR